MHTAARAPRSLLFALLSAAAPAAAQIVPIRTVPVASGDQFLMLPSTSLAMGGVRLALDDSLADAWTNPTKGSFVGQSAFLSSPTFYTIEAGGGARTFPVAGVLGSPIWFGGLAFALQQVADGADGDFRVARPWIDIWPGPSMTLSRSSSRNLYAAAYAGLRLGPAWSLGIGLGAASLDAMDGVDLLYAGADRIEQSGGTTDARLGTHREGERNRAALLLLHSRIAMTHEVSYVEWVWDPDRMTGSWQTRLEENEDRTQTWGAHLEWDRSLAASGWRIGASGTVNYKSHSKIPNYEIQNIPRDPGTTWAYEIAFGFARTSAATTFGFDVAFQPIWSETWQEADSTDVAMAGGRLARGDRSIENDFFFTNVVLRTGVAHEVCRATLQGGLEVRSHAYGLEQVDRVTQRYREQDETWMEWTPTFGVALEFSSLDLRYSGRITTGTGRPGAAWTPETMMAPSRSQSDFIVAPSGPVTLVDSDVVTHQLSARLPVRRAALRRACRRGSRRTMPRARLDTPSPLLRP